MKAVTFQGTGQVRVESVADPTIQDPSDLLNYIALQAPGTWIDVNVNRSGRILAFKTQVAKRDQDR